MMEAKAKAMSKVKAKPSVKAKAKPKKSEIETRDDRPDLRDFIEHVIGRLLSASVLVYILSLAFFTARTLFISIPIGIAYMAVVVIVVRRMSNNSEKRIRKGKRYKFMDVNNLSGWIMVFGLLAMIGGFLLLLDLWISNNLKHYWYLTVLSAVLMLFSVIFLPDGIGDTSVSS